VLGGHALVAPCGANCCVWSGPRLAARRLRPRF
jgi:hypothetical protein